MDGISTNTLLIILGVLVFVSAFFSSSETGMMSLNKYKLRHMSQSGDKTAQKVSQMLDRPDRLIGLILIGNNLVNIAASSIATVICLRLFGDYGVAVATFGLTIVLLIFAEVTPKTLAAYFPEKIAFPASYVLRALMVPFYPFVWGLNLVTNGVLKLFRINLDNREDSLTHEELKTVVNEAGALIPRRHQDMLLSVLDLENVTVDDIMVPRNEIAGIDINDDWKDIVKQLTHGTHTRILLYRDTVDDAVGFVHSRDVLRLLSKTQFSKETLLRAVREIYFVPEGTPLNVQLLKFQRNKIRIGLVVDEYGDIQGLITLEDILEEIVGDFTTTMDLPTSNTVKQNDGSFLVDASSNIRDLNKQFKWKLPEDGPRTLNGLILEHLEDIPNPNVCFRLAGYPMEVLDVKENMVKQVKVMASEYRKPRKSA
ncbi:transporter [Catenovulum agarivorans DS-2]|uniref:Transporter n=1 Tax=Catenovulum agarivorans DS-2 TaxID=1328313 RepID=W7QEI1_9ALTE|nr:HlyC/CorC family transporter [Catenovulum agarivorans]EWH11294.1 transporter [Catenovulum agarivorans DS-2]